MTPPYAIYEGERLVGVAKTYDVANAVIRNGKVSGVDCRKQLITQEKYEKLRQQQMERLMQGFEISRRSKKWLKFTNHIHK